MWTRFDWIMRSMRANASSYVFYGFALACSAALYFIFAFLQNEAPAESAAVGGFRSAEVFQAAGILTVLIGGAFVFRANRLFLKRRSREIGLYQLAGLSRFEVARLLLAEQALLGAAALLMGTCAGALASRFFWLLLLKLIDAGREVPLSFSGTAALQTIGVFAGLIVLALVQIGIGILRSPLPRFEAVARSFPAKETGGRAAALAGLASAALIAAGYLLADRIARPQGLAILPVVLGATLAGTYLLLRVAIGGLLAYIRSRQNGHLSIAQSLSLAPIMHRMKSTANSLTWITILSALMLTLLALASSLYYSAETESRAMMPDDFVFENMPHQAQVFEARLEQEALVFTHRSVPALRVRGVGDTPQSAGSLLLPAESLVYAGEEAAAWHVSGTDPGGALPDLPGPGEAFAYRGLERQPLREGRDAGRVWNPLHPGMDTEERAGRGETGLSGGGLRIARSLDRYAVNYSVRGRQFVVRAAGVQELRMQCWNSALCEEVRLDLYRIADPNQRAAASEAYAEDGARPGIHPDFVFFYRESLHKFGLLLFIAAFLGFVFLVSTGSLLYLRQMAEADAEKPDYAVLRRLGIDEREMMAGAVRKQLFVFAVPLAIGLLHSIFAVRAASALALSNLFIPAAAALLLYTLTYLSFAALSVRGYRRMIRETAERDMV